MAIGLAIVITVIFGGGLSAILASLEYLFEFKVPARSTSTPGRPPQR